jgi:hypothetical protein
MHARSSGNPGALTSTHRHLASSLNWVPPAWKQDSRSHPAGSAASSPPDRFRPSPPRRGRPLRARLASRDTAANGYAGYGNRRPGISRGGESNSSSHQALPDRAHGALPLHHQLTRSNTMHLRSGQGSSRARPGHGHVTLCCGHAATRITGHQVLRAIAPGWPSMSAQRLGDAARQLMDSDTTATAADRSDVSTVTTLMTCSAVCAVTWNPVTWVLARSRDSRCGQVGAPANTG